MARNPVAWYSSNCMRVLHTCTHARISLCFRTLTCTRGVRLIPLTLSAWFGPQLQVEVPLGRRPRCRGGDCCPTVVSFVTGTPLSQAWLLMLLLVMPDTAAVALVTVLHERHQQANRNITWRAWPKHRQSRWPRYHGYHSMATIGGPGPSTGSHGGATACHGYYWRSGSSATVTVIVYMFPTCWIARRTTVQACSASAAAMTATLPVVRALDFSRAMHRRRDAVCSVTSVRHGLLALRALSLLNLVRCTSTHPVRRKAAASPWILPREL